jgi:hypothetical protein
VPSLPSPVFILHALKLTHQSLGPLLFHKYASPNHSSFRFETSQEAKLHPPRQHIVNSRHVSLHRNAKKAIRRLAAVLQLRPQEEGGYCCSAAAQATRRGGVLLQRCSSGHKKRGRLAAVLQLRPQEEGEEFSAAVARVTNKHGVSPLSLKQSGGWLTRTERMSGAESGRARLLGTARNARGSMPLRLEGACR